MAGDKTSLEIGPTASRPEIDHMPVVDNSHHRPDTESGHDAAWYKKLLSRIDWRSLMPLMTTSYMIQFLDKQTLAQASIMGIVEDLSLVGDQFSWAGSIFYFGYLAASYPASLLMVRFPIAKYLAATFLVWGVVLACHAATNNFTGLIIVRFFLGAAEASISPGFSLITGMWYKREEQPLRHGIWFTGNSLATMFGGLLAYAIAHIDNDLAAWKWLFLIYAIITLTWAVLLALFLPDQPASARFLSQEERDGAIERVRENKTGAVNHKIQWDQVVEALGDYKIWLLFFFQLANNIPNGAITTFGNLIMAGFGFSTLEVYLLTMPQGFVHGTFAIASTFLAGKFPRARCALTAGCCSVTLLGCVLIYATDVQGVHLMSYYLCSAYASGIPLSLSLVSSNVAGFTKKATVSAMMFIAYCGGNIIGPFLFFDHEAPIYESGFLSIIACLSVGIILILVLGLCWKRENARRDRSQSPSGIEEHDSKGKEMNGFEQDLTDIQNNSFRYVY